MSQLPLKYDPRGLVPAIVQDHLTGQIRMFAFATEAAVRMTLQTGRATFWSRSRGELWQKGRISGHETPVVRVLADCSGCTRSSTRATPTVPRATRGLRAASSRPSRASGSRRRASSRRPCSPRSSRSSNRARSPRAARATRRASTTRARAGIGAKISEDAGELAKALESENDERVVAEAAETLYHVLVGLRSRSITLRRVLAELARRVGRSGHPERESRGTLQID